MNVPAANQFDRNEILPPDPDGLEILHDREYRIRAFRRDPNLLVRGAVRDQKPPRLYIADDPDPLTIHHMQIELEIAFPALEIVGATVLFETHPHDTCPTISSHYENLIGLSIARGFTHKVRELFGGPRGCTHSTALLQAMAPVAVQCFWSMSASNARQAGSTKTSVGGSTSEQREAAMAVNLNSCHVWADDGEMVDGIRNGGVVQVPLPIRRRFEQMGQDPEEFIRQMRGLR